MSDAIPVSAAGGNTLPQGGNGSSAPASSTPASSSGSAVSLSSAPPLAGVQHQTADTATSKPTATNRASVPDLVEQLNKFLNDSGRPNQFRIDPLSRHQTIQEINPANGEVIGEFSVAEFPALARSLGISGILVDSHA